MKTTKYEIIETPIIINVTEARLLTKEEAETLPKRLRLYRLLWWTSSADISDRYNALDVNGYDGSFERADIGIVDAVRPALIFESNSLKVGDGFSFGGKVFEVIKESLAFCTTDIGMHAFRKDWQAEDANQYEASDIKKYVDNWFKENMR